mmetsp:Transcript_24470/g.53204  ORF Transcript_24470/g.53204 Transcript_24470/m.53204 type:complete len:501 (+) Transcript_24470:334-1836(+)
MPEAIEGLQGALLRILTASGLEQKTACAVNTVCLLIIASIATVWVLLKLASVLVPLTFAIFLGFLVEPLLSRFVLIPFYIYTATRRLRRRCRGNRDRRHGSLSLPTSTGTETEVSSECSLEPPYDVEGGRSQSQISPLPDSAIQEVGGLGEPTANRRLEPELNVPTRPPTASSGGTVSPRDRTCCWRIVAWLQGPWEILAIILCVCTIGAAIFGIAEAIVGALVSFDWTKYETSPKLLEIKKMMGAMGISIQDIVDGSIVTKYRGEVMSVALEVLNVLESVLLTLLLFFFVLVAMLPGIRQRPARPSQMKVLMQRYLLVKTLASLVVALGVMLSLWLMKVELVPIFGLITFILNYIPNIGSLFAILAPLPLVWLEPESTLIRVANVAIVPFVVHNTLGNLLEPQMMAQGLELHPLTVVVALTFWGSLWGIAGAVLSVPITCAIRLKLAEFDHPYARSLHRLLDDPLGPKRASSRAKDDDRTSPETGSSTTLSEGSDSERQ